MTPKNEHAKKLLDRLSVPGVVAASMNTCYGDNGWWTDPTAPSVGLGTHALLAAGERAAEALPGVEVLDLYVNNLWRVMVMPLLPQVQGGHAVVLVIVTIKSHPVGKSIRRAAKRAAKAYMRERSRQVDLEGL